jgi:hypothetical protein
VVNPGDEYMQVEDDSVFSCDCGCWPLGRRWFIAACVFEGTGVLALIGLLYWLYNTSKGSK